MARARTRGARRAPTRQEIERDVQRVSASRASYHDDHLCAACGAKFSSHGGEDNPHALPRACPPGPFPAWPTSISDEAEAGRVFDDRVARYWQASRSTFIPRS